MKQVPGSTTYSLALYYMMTTPVKDAPLLESFINGDDAYRNSRFKLIPYISEVCEDDNCCTLSGLQCHGFLAWNFYRLMASFVEENTQRQRKNILSTNYSIKDRFYAFLS